MEQRNEHFNISFPLKRRWVKRLLAFVAVIAFAWLLKGVAYRAMVVYVDAGLRSKDQISNIELQQWISQAELDDKPTDPAAALLLAQRLTTDHLSFTTAPCPSDPNLIWDPPRANCVGYARFCAAVCNQILRRHGWGNAWRAEPRIGHLRLLGMDVHRWFDSPFFKDHDFVVLVDRDGKTVAAVDPTVDDYGGIESVSCTH